MTKRKRPVVWVIMHYEFMFDDHIDSVQFHVSSSRKKAEQYIHKIFGVAPYSWWQIHAHAIDCDPWADDVEGAEVYYYSHTGKPLKSAPQKKALAAYRKAKTKGKL